MKKEEFIELIVTTYNAAREFSPQVSAGRNNITRCRSHSISSIAEDILAAFVHDICEDFKIYVDCPLTIKDSKGKSSTFYPDIVITKDKKIYYLLDMKMDTGWFRDSIEAKANNHNDIAAKIQKAGTIIHHVKNSKTIEFTAADDLCYDIIIVTAKNGPKNYDNVVQSVNNTQKTKCKIMTLTKGQHPNTYNNKILVQPHCDFENFEEKLKSLNNK